MKKGSNKEGLIVFSLFAILLSSFFLLFFFIRFPATPAIPMTGYFVEYGTGPFYYNCSDCADCSAAILNASSGDVVMMNTSAAASGICINMYNKTGITFDCMNNSIIGTGYGIYLVNVDNSQIRNCGITVSNAIRLLYSSSNTITNVVTSGNTGSGITLDSSNNNVLTGIHSFFDPYGIYLYSSSANALSGIFLTSNQYGVTFVISNNNMFSNSHIENSGVIGINSSASNSNVFTNITLNNDATGIFVETSSYNTLKDSHITGNSYGAYFTYAYNNLFYNNYFNNTNNYYAPDTCLTGAFNTAKTSATNIIGGNYTGGNFWANPSGTGFSQNCSADSNHDKICDASYNISCITFDYLPLIYRPANVTSACDEMWSCTNWSSCVSGIKTRTCSDYNFCGTNNTRPALSQNCTVSNQTVITPPTNPVVNNTGVLGTEGVGTSITQNLTTITPTNPAVVAIDDSQIYLTRIILNVLESIQAASVTITKVNVLSNATLAMGLPSGQFYQAFRVDTSGVTSSNIANVTIEFKVNKAWLASKNGTFNGVKLYRRPDTSSQWNNLGTFLTSEDSQYYYFTSVSPGFSTFAVFFKPCQGSECETGTSGGLTKGSILLYSLIAFVGIAIIVTSFFLFRKLRKKEPKV